MLRSRTPKSQQGLKIRARPHLNQIFIYSNTIYSLFKYNVYKKCFFSYQKVRRLLRLELSQHRFRSNQKDQESGLVLFQSFRFQKKLFDALPPTKTRLYSAFPISEIFIFSLKNYSKKNNDMCRIRLLKVDFRKMQYFFGKEGERRGKKGMTAV